MSRFFALLISLSVALSQLVNAAELEASLAKQQLVLGEQVELSLSYQGPEQFFQPDFSALQQDFELLATQQQTRAKQQHWRLQLRPKRLGRLVIPALTLGAYSSTPLTLEVVSNQPLPQLDRPLLLEAQLERSTVYLQAQARLTVRLLHRMPLFPDATLSPLQLSSARVEALGPPKVYQVNQDQQHFGVIELNYAIFPQQPGLLEIPALAFSATAAGEQPTRVAASSQPLLLQVLPIPAEYPSDAPWIPARKLEVEHQVLPANGNVLQGSPLTYQVKFTAEGLPSSLLPNLSMNLPEGFHLYPEPAQTLEHKQPQGLISEKRLRAALVINPLGQFSIPTPAITWWNTETQQVMRTQLPALAVNVSERPLHAPLPSTKAAAITQPQLNPLLFWQLLSGFSLALAALNFYLWRRARRQPAVLVQTTPTESESAFKAVLRACENHQPQQARQALDQWITFHPETLHELSQRFPELASALDDLNRCLYSPEAGEWQGTALLKVLQALKNQQQSNDASQHNLPPLYPQ